MQRPSLGVMSPYVEQLITSGGFVREWTAAIEGSSADSVWAVEHVVVAEDYAPNYPYAADGLMPSGKRIVPAVPDPLELLSFMAACSRELLLGTAVIIAPLHSPVLLAKRAATLASLSGGRLRLGLGIGWQREEYAAVGAPFARRGERLEESVAVMRELWRHAPASYHGETVSFDRLHLAPLPATGPVPIVLGGHSDAAVRRAGRIADGWFPYTIGPDDFARQADLLRVAAQDAGRDPADIEVTVWPGSRDADREFDPAFVARYVRAGASRVLVNFGMREPADLDGLPARIAWYEDEVLAQLS